MAVRANQDNFEELVLKSPVPVLVDFYSDSCIPCKMISPMLAELEEAHEGSLSVVKVNVGFETGLTEAWHVMAAPTLVLFQNGTEVGRISGKLKKQELESFAGQVLAGE
jgi:thioredoxin 1